MKIINTISEVRESSKKISRKGNGRIAVIVLVQISPKKSEYGVQFWNEVMIEIGVATNNDKSVSKFIEIL